MILRHALLRGNPAENPGSRPDAVADRAYILTALDAIDATPRRVPLEGTTPRCEEARPVAPFALLPVKGALGR